MFIDAFCRNCAIKVYRKSIKILKVTLVDKNKSMLLVKYLICASNAEIV